MLKNSIKVRKTRGGNIIKEVREHYLRKEIPCGISGCSQCLDFPNKEVLDPTRDSGSSLFPSPHFLIPTLDILIKQIDFFENENIFNVIILQTVINSIKSSNLGVYNRLQVLLNTKERCFFMFNNEFHIDTFITQQKDEILKAWEFRLFSKACDWYARHLYDNFPTVIAVGIYCQTPPSCIAAVGVCSVFDYVKSLVWHDELIDSLVLEEHQILLKELESKISFPEHISTSAINIALKTSKYYCGIYRQSQENCAAGTLKVRGADKIFSISGILNINRAFDNDLVIVEPINEIPDSVSLCQIDDGLSFEISDWKSISVPSDKYCRVVGIIRRNWKQYCGILFKETIMPGFFLFKPDDSRIPYILFESKNPDSLKNKKICLSVDQWNAKLRYPVGHFVKILGNVGDKIVESNAILFEQRIPFQSFSKDVLDCLPDLTNPVAQGKPDWNVESVLLNDPNRRDLRHLNICSIDPPGCTDIDDAVHCRLVNDKKNIYEIGIHIADVSHYVIPGTAVDKEAYRRGTTVYLVDRRVDMLPELLSSQLCSLRPNVDRLAFSVLCYVDSQGQIVESMPPIFTKSAIRSSNAFTYSEAQAVINDKNDKSQTSMMLKKLVNLTKFFRKRRLQRGALVLDSPELRFEVDSETLEPLELNVKESFETNKLIEDCMLLANVLVAQKIRSAFPHLALLRCHPFPSSDSLKSLFESIGTTLGISQPPDSKTLPVFLESASSSHDPFVKKLLSILSIRCLQQATYICAGCHSSDSYYHYGLAEPIYTHFTSPIRRYPDIIVHRMLAASINTTGSGILAFYDSKMLQQICDHLNRRHISAQIASRQSAHLHLFMFLKSKNDPQRREIAYITKIHKNAISLYVPSYHYQGLLRFDDKICESLGTKIDPQAGNIKAQKPSIKVSVLDRVTIRLETENQHSSSGIKLILIKPNIPGISNYQIM